MRNNKRILRITAFIIALFTVILISKINSYASQKKPIVLKDTYYTIKNDKLIDNKVFAAFGNRIYDTNGNLYNIYADENGKLNESYEYSLKRDWTNIKISLYIDDNEEPYKTYDISFDTFWSYENSFQKASSGLSCSDDLKCKNRYEFDLTGLEIKESFRIEFSWQKVVESNDTKEVHPYSEYIKFIGHSEDGDIIINKTHKDYYLGEVYTENIKNN